jgi:hypothetical protein
MNQMTAIKCSPEFPQSSPAVMCPPECGRGNRDLDFSDPAFPNGLPDLSKGRMLEDALAHLDWIAANAPGSYAHEWVEECVDCGVDVRAHIEDVGTRLNVGCALDGLERNVWCQALVKHFKRNERHRQAITDHLVQSGRYFDLREVSTRDLFDAMRDFLRHGGRVMINPKGQVKSKFDLGKLYPRDGGSDPAPELVEAVLRFTRLERRWDGRGRLKRAVRVLGEATPNGWVVLEQEAA